MKCHQPKPICFVLLLFLAMQTGSCGVQAREVPDQILSILKQLSNIKSPVTQKEMFKIVGVLRPKLIGEARIADWTPSEDRTAWWTRYDIGNDGRYVIECQSLHPGQARPLRFEDGILVSAKIRQFITEGDYKINYKTVLPVWISDAATSVHAVPKAVRAAIKKLPGINEGTMEHQIFPLLGFAKPGKSIYEFVQGRSGAVVLLYPVDRGMQFALYYEAQRNVNPPSHDGVLTHVEIRRFSRSVGSKRIYEPLLPIWINY